MSNKVTLQSEEKPFPVDENLRPLKIGGKSSSLELSQHENGSGARITGGLEVNGTGKSIVAEPLITNNINSTDDLTLDVNGGIALDPSNGALAIKKAGTEYSVANSAYAGTILGYKTIGIDAADASYNVTTSFVVVGSDHKVNFVAPPSGAVEIEVFIYADCASGGRPLRFGLSDNATYSPIDFPNSNDVTNEHEVFAGDETDEVYINHRWVVTGLTSGTAYEWWLGASCTHVFVFVLRWGGNVTAEYAPFIMKATALPGAVADFAVYG